MTDKANNSEDPVSALGGRAVTPASADVVVVGGGLAGLTAAAVIAQAGRRVVVREKRGVLGGNARSVNDDGFTFNQGPHALYRGGAGERVLTALGLGISGGQPPVKGRLVFDGQTWIAPVGPPTLLRTKALKAGAKLQIAKTLSRLPRLRAADYAEVTVADWTADAVSDERAAEMIHALVRLATYANKPDLLSADVAIAQMQAALGPGVLYLNGGWQTLVDQLAAKPGVRIETGGGVTELPDAPAVIIAGGGPRIAEALLGRQFDVGPPAHASCLDLGLRRRPEHDIVIGGDVPFYFSNHSSVAKLAPDGQHHASAVQYLAAGDEPDADATMAFARHAGVQDDDVVVSRRLHRMTACSALPVAESGGLAGRPKVTDTGHRNVFIAGDWVGPVGHLADAAIASAKASADAALALLASRAAA